jgi:hypothetical protein
MGERWEYKIVYVAAGRLTSMLPADIKEEFDRFGADGWELVATEAIRPSWLWSTGTTVIGFFKRRLQV